MVRRTTIRGREHSDKTRMIHQPNAQGCLEEGQRQSAVFVGKEREKCSETWVEEGGQGEVPGGELAHHRRTFSWCGGLETDPFVTFLNEGCNFPLDYDVPLTPYRLKFRDWKESRHRNARGKGHLQHPLSSTPSAIIVPPSFLEFLKFRLYKCFS